MKDQNSGEIAVKIIVSGEVQGVGFRYFIARAAESLNITGYAKNLWSGEVEIFGEGDRKSLEELMTKAKEGPRHARVDSCKVEWLESKNKYDIFEIY